MTENASSDINVSMIASILRMKCTPPISQRKKESIDPIVNFTEGQDSNCRLLEKPRFIAFQSPGIQPQLSKLQISVF